MTPSSSMVMPWVKRSVTTPCPAPATIRPIARGVSTTRRATTSTTTWQPATRRLDHQARHRDAFALVADGSSEGLADEESQEIAAAVDAPDGDLSPEEGALHIIDDDEVG